MVGNEVGDLDLGGRAAHDVSILVCNHCVCEAGAPCPYVGDAFGDSEVLGMFDHCLDVDFGDGSQVACMLLSASERHAHERTEGSFTDSGEELCHCIRGRMPRCTAG